MKTIELSQGKVAKLDDADYRRLSSYRWWFADRYAVRQKRVDGKVQNIFMHREIAGPKTGEFVDHINGDGLDNRRSNLRVCSHRLNRANSKRYSTNKSGFKGVWWSAKDKRWVAGIKVNYKRIILGYFQDKEKAAEAYNEAAIRHWGKFARLNQIKPRKAERGKIYCPPLQLR